MKMQYKLIILLTVMLQVICYKHNQTREHYLPPVSVQCELTKLAIPGPNPRCKLSFVIISDEPELNKEF